MFCQLNAERKREKIMKKKILENTLFSIFVVITISIMLCNFFLVNACAVRGESMSPTYSDKQIILMSKIAYKDEVPERNDIIVVDARETIGTRCIIKRIVGLPGETVEMKNNKLYINGIELEEEYIKEEMIDNTDKTWTLGEDEYFICGDNRNNSYDSRDIGPVDFEDIMGKIIK